ncbi:hypothetical protein [Paenibacillus hexagrammi]|uniref:Uncharacterized protein n=1 Tax=Paenibacillus hexagrammi TaxID=2908839 RepID=A0ABY3SJT4_9BACL|nr:hypothetical protein [Paenibacillus sp. YPD9-1]UJF34312.1 hypothetical protein L0M14_03625 [Paenibacillus sp. YPD9-1]
MYESNKKLFDENFRDQRKKVTSKSTKLNITDMDSKGMVFRSFLRLPKNENVVCCFQFIVNEIVITLEGDMKDCRKTKLDYEYLFEWRGEEVDNALITLSTVIKNDAIHRRKAARQYEYFNLDYANKALVDIVC